MDKISLRLIIQRLDEISIAAYHEQIDGVEASFRIDSVIDELKGWKELMEE